MWYICLKGQKHARQYTEKWRGYTSRAHFEELDTWQHELIEYRDAKTPIEKAIVPHGDGYAWRYLRDGQYVYAHIKRAVPQKVFEQYYIQNIYASRVSFRVK